MTMFDLAMKIIDAEEYILTCRKKECRNKEEMEAKGIELFKEVYDKLEGDNKAQWEREFQEIVNKKNFLKKIF